MPVKSYHRVLTVKRYACDCVRGDPYQCAAYHRGANTRLRAEDAADLEDMEGDTGACRCSCHGGLDEEDDARERVQDLTEIFR